MEEYFVLVVYILLVVAVVSVFVLLGVRFDRKQQQKAVEGIQDEPHDEDLVFKNMPNFRQAGGTSLYNRYGHKIKDGLLFRSSRTDFLTDAELEQFLELGIKSIIDLRRNREYIKADGDKILDRAYQPCVLKKGEIKDWRSSRKMPSGGSLRGRRYLVNLMTIELIKNVVYQVNFIVRYSSLLLLAVDWFFGSHLFVRVFSHLVSNRQTLAEQYMVMLEHTKPVVADIMRLLLDASNVPVLIHCAHGKDRTGVIVALVLGCLEVEHEIIATDYALSQSGLGPMRKRLYWESVGQYGFKRDFALATPDTMRDLLTEISKRYGSIPGYLSAAGFTVDEQQALKDIFLETC